MSKISFSHHSVEAAGRACRRLFSAGKVLGISLAFIAVLFTSVLPVTAQEVFPPVIPLPDGFRPEGIAVGTGTTFFVGSIPTGAIFKGDLRTGQGDLLVQPTAGRAAIGLEYDDRTGYLFVAGGGTGQAYVYDAESGELLAEFQLADPGTTFINDVVITREAAYFTSSFTPVFYRIPLGSGGELLDNPDIQMIELSGDFVQQGGIGVFNSNGIDATPNGKWLIIVNSTLGTLYRVDPLTGLATEIDLNGAAVPAGDGILLLGHTLYVVQNMLNQISVIELSPDYTSGELVATLEDTVAADFDIPTTAAVFGRYLYVVNARFATPPTPQTEYNVVQVVR